MYKWSNGTELYHHGIKGQKWGIRRYQNEDGSYTAAGKERRKLTDWQVNASKNALKDTYDKRVPERVFAITGADRTALDNAKRILDNAVELRKDITEKKDELFKELEANNMQNGTYIYYAAVSEIAADANMYRRYRNANGVEDLTLREMSDCVYQALWSDGQQATINAYSAYALDHGIADEVYKIASEYTKKEMQINKDAADAIDKALGDVGGQVLDRMISDHVYTIGKQLVNSIVLNDDSNRNYYKGKYLDGPFCMDDAGYAKNFTNTEKSDIESAKKVVSRVKNNRDENTWELFNEAIENLGLETEKVSGLSDSDWNRINEEISRLR